jgi:parallel beta-helix repeat protein
MPASAAPPLQCGSVVTQSATLTTDLVCSGTALTIGADNVTLDLKGHTITGPGIYVGETAGVSVVERSGVTVTNGTITGFRYGVRADTTNNTTLTKLYSHHNLRGFDLANGQGLNVSKNTVTFSDLDAIRVGGSDDSLIAQNVVSDNVFGIYVADYAGNVTVSRNQVTRTRGAGLAAFSGVVSTVFSQNTVSANGGSGIDVHDDAFDTLVVQNTSFGNGLDGISVAGTTTVTQNSAYSNGQLGIRAVSPPVVDGGGNKAWDNGDSRQCVGVTCTVPSV